MQGFQQIGNKLKYQKVPLGTREIVATDFNPLEKDYNTFTRLGKPKNRARIFHAEGLE